MASLRLQITAITSQKTSIEQELLTVSAQLKVSRASVCCSYGNCNRVAFHHHHHEHLLTVVCLHELRDRCYQLQCLQKVNWLNPCLCSLHSKEANSTVLREKKRAIAAEDKAHDFQARWKATAEYVLCVRGV